MFLWYPVLDLATAPRRTARKKGSGYENVPQTDTITVFNPVPPRKSDARGDKNVACFSRIRLLQQHNREATVAQQSHLNKTVLVGTLKPAVRIMLDMIAITVNITRFLHWRSQ